MAALADLFAGLVRYHTALPAAPVPPSQPGITWIWAANGIFKRGVSKEIDLCVQITATPPTPGLASLLPYVWWPGDIVRIPGGLLHTILEHARRAVGPRTPNTSSGILVPLEQQYFLTYRAGLPAPYRVAVPEQEVTPGSITYKLPKEGTILLDLHSHHGMHAYFSNTDNRDDTGLSVSAVIGRIFDDPEVIVRLNCYGHHQVIPATMVFTDTGPFRERGGLDADFND